jgi:Gas vesicle protein
MSISRPAIAASSPTSSSQGARAIATSTQGSSLADVLERVLDKGIVIAGDISVSVADTELLNIRIRLLISSVDKAREIGINWWENNPHFNAQANGLIAANQQLQQRVESLESELKHLRSLPASPIINPISSPTIHPMALDEPSETDLSLDALAQNF